MVECGGLENRFGASQRGFESLPLRQKGIVARETNLDGRRKYNAIECRAGNRCRYLEQCLAGGRYETKTDAAKQAAAADANAENASGGVSFGLFFGRH